MDYVPLQMASPVLSRELLKRGRAYRCLLCHKQVGEKRYIIFNFFFLDNESSTSTPSIPVPLPVPQVECASGFAPIQLNTPPSSTPVEDIRIQQGSSGNRSIERSQDRSRENSREGSSNRTQERSLDKSRGNSRERSQERSRGKLQERSQESLRGKPSEKSQDKLKEHPEDGSCRGSSSSTPLARGPEESRRRSQERSRGNDTSPTRLLYDMVNHMFHLQRTMQNIHHELQSQTDILRSMRDQRVDRNRSPPPDRRNFNNKRPGNFYNGPMKRFDRRQ